MSEEKLKRIENKLNEILSMMYVLDIALNNPEHLTDDTEHYGRFAGLIKQKLNKMYSEFL